MQSVMPSMFKPISSLFSSLAHKSKFTNNFTSTGSDHATDLADQLEQELRKDGPWKVEKLTMSVAVKTFTNDSKDTYATHGSGNSYEVIWLPEDDQTTKLQERVRSALKQALKGINTNTTPYCKIRLATEFVIKKEIAEGDKILKTTRTITRESTLSGLPSKNSKFLEQIYGPN